METRSRQIRPRVANACDICKARKIKCSGTAPCTYCSRRQQPENCRYTAQQHQRRRRAGTRNYEATSSPAHEINGIATNNPILASGNGDRPQTPGPPSQGISVPVSSALATSASQGDPNHHHLPSDHRFASAAEEHEETEVPREARLLCDPQGKLVFIGDCAPLSFFQTVRRLVTTRVDANAFAPETSGYSALENVYSRTSFLGGSGGGQPPTIEIAIEPAIQAYLEATAGLIDIFDTARLLEDISTWATGRALPRDKTVNVTSVVNYLVLAIACQKSDESVAQMYFDYARDLAFANLSGNLSVGSVQAFLLITLYMLSSCQISGAFLFFGIAVRAAYSIGIHRTEVNSRFGPEIHRQRDRIWKSLRVVDLFLSTSMGRPPATSDIDCTVSYRAIDEDGREAFDLLNASVQIFLITEGIVLEVYSRRKISPQLTEGISLELRDWSSRWLKRLKEAIDGTRAAAEDQPGAVNGVCQVLSSYYYAVILVSRPFLMVELRRRLSEETSSVSVGKDGVVSGKSRLADACIDAASLMVDPIQDLIEGRLMTRRAPVIVSWLFASSLVLGLGLLGGFGRVIEKHCRSSIAALEYFAEADAHAVQYSLIAKSLLATALDYLEKKEAQEHRKRTEISSQLFGFIPREPRENNESGQLQGPDCQQTASPSGTGTRSLYKPDRVRQMDFEGPTPRLDFDFESTFLGLTESLSRTPEFSLMGGSLDSDADQAFGALNLFPLLETDGHIDLANYF
ncbi:hypothetical protein B0T22DRAFT_374852 [Podospora appendiculata]|uniref:Zn(2)-C6 fungal-type domain-containing protein n=1 Tax=Podospora appendiculata TaxID=314037 RepID=A0AAE1CE45_9PEZI|nr:hypothetical protein B0T22DRAFT_374852 [Podospora appendiculata]